MEFWARRPFLQNFLGGVLLAVLWGGLFLLGHLLLPVDGLPWYLVWGVRSSEVLVATLVVIRMYDRMPAIWAGLGMHRWILREILIGLTLGAVMAAAASLPSLLMGGVSADTLPDGRYTFHLALSFLFAATFEELLFRGYFYQRLIEMIGVVAATLTASIGFALMHLVRPEITPWAFLNIVLAGIFFSLCYLRSGSLWLPIAAHAVWNMVLAMLFGLPVSGVGHGAGVLGVPVVGPDLLTGGAFGPEGSLVTMVVLVIGITLVGLTSMVTFSPYTYARVFRAFQHRRRPMEGGTGSS